MRITNEKGWETIPGETGSMCTFESCVFYFVCLDSCFESLRVLLDVFRLFTFVFPLSRRFGCGQSSAQYPVKNSFLNFQKSSCAQSAVPFSTLVQNSSCSFIKLQGSPPISVNSRTKTYLKLCRFQTAKQKKKENSEQLRVFQLWQDPRLHFKCTFPDLAIFLEYECISTPSVSLLQVRMAIKAATDVISCQHKQGGPF